MILAVMPLLALVNQLVCPAQSAALPRLLDDEDRVAANSAFSVAYQGVDAVANAPGGVLTAVLGGIVLFALDVVTFLAPALLSGTERPSRAGFRRFRQSITDGRADVRFARPAGTPVPLHAVVPDALRPLGHDPPAGRERVGPRVTGGNDRRLTGVRGVRRPPPGPQSAPPNRTAGAAAGGSVPVE